MSQVSKKKFKQVTLSSFVSSSPPKKRKFEDDIRVEDESKNRKISDSVSTKPNKTEVSESTITDGTSVCNLIANTSGRRCPEKVSKIEEIESQDIDLEVLTKQTPEPDVSEESVSSMNSDGPSRRDELVITESTPLNASQEPRNSDSITDSESSPSRKFGIPEVKKLTPKQLQKKREMEARRVEREKLRLEKEKERLEKKEEKEKKRLAEIEAKNEEKRQREERKMKEEEQRRLKEAEKKAKEDEKQKKIEEIRSREEQEKKKKERTAATFKNFFVPKNKANVPKVLIENSDNQVSRLFMPFEVKENMKLAFITRATLTFERKHYLDSIIRKDASDDECSSYLADLRSKRYKPGRAENTWPINLNDEDDLKDDNLPRTRFKCKLLQFDENRRPAYWGTWRKRSKTVSGKTPFKCDSELEYDVDSDEEWVEEPGESLHGSDDEKESDHEYEVDNDLFVPHGYLSDEEAPQDDEANNQNQTKKLDLLKTEFEAELKEKTFKLKSRSYGCTWIANDTQKGADEIEELLLFFRAVYSTDQTPFSFRSEAENISHSSSGSKTPAVRTKVTTTFPEQFVPDLIRLVHGNKMGAKHLGTEFVAYVAGKETDLCLAQVCVKRKLREIAHWDQSRQLWYVRDEIRQQYGLEELSSTENKWIYVTSITSIWNQPKKSLTCTTASIPSVASSAPKHNPITKFVKVLKPEDREKQLNLNLVEKKAELLSYVISPKRTDTVPESRETSTSDPPLKKRAILYTVRAKPGGNLTTTESTPFLAPAVTLTTPPVSCSNETLITKVNPIRNKSDDNIEIDVVKSETSPIVAEGGENEQQTVGSISATTINEERHGGLEKQSNVIVKEEKKKVELPKYVISPQRTDFVVEPPFKKRAVLYSVKREGNSVVTENTSLTPAVASAVVVSPSSESQVTKVNPVIQDKLDGTSEDGPALAMTLDKENNEDQRRQSNITVKEGKKYATLISINKARE